MFLIIFVSLIPNWIFVSLGKFEILQFCQFVGFLPRKLQFQISFETRFRKVPYFVKTGTSAKWVKKIRFYNVAQYIFFIIYQTLCLLSLIANNTQNRTLEAIRVIRSRKNGSQIQKINDFSSSKYDIPTTVCPILMMKKHHDFILFSD